ncbi:MAG TPA: hypothetical protein VD735_00210 [Candidatus Saccharimonadales bacterium]|nr:hypothetical protein [Candidatus Saccharimonadales bacterium]
MSAVPSKDETAAAAMGANALLREKLKEVTAYFVDGTPEAYKALRTIYPEHIYDPLRREIAIELAGKEVAKILDAEDNDRLEQIRSAVDDLYDGRQGVYAPIHDFWSLVEMILHVKKKELPELITAENVTWKQENLPIEQLHLTWMPFLEQHQDIFGEKPWSVADIQRIFFQKPELFKQARDEQQKSVGPQQHGFDQSEEPIALIHRNDQLELIDGNGRLYRALLNGNETVACQIGRMKGSMPQNYWVSAGALKQFCLEIKGYAEVDLEGFASGVSYLRTKLRNNALALTNYELFLRKDFPEFEASLEGVLSS